MTISGGWNSVPRKDEDGTRRGRDSHSLQGVPILPADADPDKTRSEQSEQDREPVDFFGDARWPEPRSAGDWIVGKDEPQTAGDWIKGEGDQAAIDNMKATVAELQECLEALQKRTGGE